MSLIEVKNLAVAFNGETIIENISFVINSGEYIALIGANGSGKSTLAKAISDLEAYQGEIFINDGLITKHNANLIRNQVGIVFQNPDNQFVGVTVENDIAFGLENKNTPRDQMIKTINDILTELGMSSLKDKEPQHLSGGQKQKVAIASILVMKPNLIIFDEATSMLDEKSKNEIHAAIKRIRQHRPELSIIFITHNLEELTSEITRVIYLDNKTIKFDGTKDEVYQQLLLLEPKKVRIPLLDEIRLSHHLQHQEAEGLIEELWESL
ncbi:MAG: ATP-binding cassette domain-containing protein [Erysipelotrichaceae bacterium]|jgi:energy-coupling factor transport system ATP-binding protein|nr:ATP-binding cassette domain-containing protein [Erysipelotrichaceae bacterium]